MKKKVLYLLTLALLAAVPALQAYAEEEYYEEEYEEDGEEEEETEYIPEYLYDPIQSNEIEGWPQGPAVRAASAIVMDLDTGAQLYAKSIYDKRYPASITKIMTGMIIVENCDLDDEITFSNHVYELEENASNVALEEGETMTIGDAVYALMLESANDAGNGLAEYYSGSNSSFADVMNAKAAELGCVNTHFTNPHGLHNDDHYTCAYDMALIARAAWQIPKMREILQTTLYHCPETNKVEERYFVMHHKMIQEESDYYRDWCRGGKTGFTSDAWATLVTYGEKDGQNLVCVVMRELNMDWCYEETIQLMNYGFDEFENISLGYDASGKSFYGLMGLDYLGTGKNLSHVSWLEQPVISSTQAGTVTVPNGWSGQELSTEGSLSEGLEGTLTYTLGDQVLGTSSMRFTPVNFAVSLPYQRELDMEKILASSETVRKSREVQEVADAALENIRTAVDKNAARISGFIEENRLAVLIAGGGLLLLVLALIFILLARCSTDARLQKKKRQEERARLRREEEIDRQTTEEIEQELRAAMEEEAKKRAEEEARRRAQEEEEAQLRETEQIIEELSGKKK